jgi:hypothetical protein
MSSENIGKTSPLTSLANFFEIVFLVYASVLPMTLISIIAVSAIS